MIALMLQILLHLFGLGILSELQIITIDDDEATFIILDPILITLVQTLSSGGIQESCQGTGGNGI